jgi:hypothetical protein
MKGNDLLKGEFSERTKVCENLKFNTPQAAIQKKWEEMAHWVFLGCVDEDSIFFLFPIFNLVHMITFTEIGIFALYEFK